MAMPPFEPRGRYEGAIRSVVVLARGASPTADIYLKTALAGARRPVRFVDMEDPALQAGEAFSDGAFVVIVRYLNRRSAAQLKAAQGRLSGVAYLMDDDLPAISFGLGLPPGYALRQKLFWRRYKAVLSRLASEIWVTSDGLEAKYGGPRVKRVEPIYLGPAGEVVAPVRVFYHATASHNCDYLWLRQVIEEVQRARGDVLFELVTERRMRPRLAGLARSRLLHPMGWQDYLAYASAERLDIGLAPLSPGGLNETRSYNKLLDITRLGAAGIYADRAPFAGLIEDGVSGLLRRHDAAAWAEAILTLAADPPLRRRLSQGGEELCRALAEKERAKPLWQQLRGDRGGGR